MKSGYKIVWTDHALAELQETVDYLLTHWTERELRNFSKQLDRSIELISKKSVPWSKLSALNKRNREWLNGVVN